MTASQARAWNKRGGRVVSQLWAAASGMRSERRDCWAYGLRSGWKDIQKVERQTAAIPESRSTGACAKGRTVRPSRFTSRLLAATALATSVVIAACGGSMKSSRKPDQSPALTPVGLLPFPTQRPLETPPAGARGPAASCSVVNLISCVKPGVVINGGLK